MLPTLRHMRDTQGTLCVAAYLLSLMIPLLLIVHRTAADAFTCGVGVLFLIECTRRRNWAWLKDPILRVLLAAWLWMLIVTPFAHDIQASFGIAGPWIRYILLYAALTAWVLREEPALRLLTAVLAALLSGVIVDTLWQYHTGVSLTGRPISSSGRLTGPLNNIKVGIYAAKLLIPAAGLCFFFACRNKHRTLTAIAVLLAFGGIITLMLAGERVAFLTTAAAFCLGSFLMAMTEPRWRLRCVMSAAFLLLICALLYINVHWIQIRAYQLYAILSDFGNSSYGQLYRAGYDLGREHLLTGVGLKNFRLLCPGLQQQGLIEHCNLHPHSPYIEWFAEAGLIGLLLFAAFVLLLLKQVLASFHRHAGILRIPSLIALGTWIVHFAPLVPTQSFFSNWPAILLWYSLAAGFSTLNLVRENA